MTYTVQGVRKLLVRNGWSCQVPARRALERYDEAVAGWVKEVWPCAERGGPWSLARLRGRIRLLHDAAAREDVVAARPHPGGARPRTLPQTHLHRRADLLQARPEVATDLPAPPRRRQPRRTHELLLARLPRPAHRRPHPARRTGRPRPGQPQRPQGSRTAGVRRDPGLADHLLSAALRTRPNSLLRGEPFTGARGSGVTPARTGRPAKCGMRRRPQNWRTFASWLDTDARGCSRPVRRYPAMGLEPSHRRHGPPAPRRRQSLRVTGPGTCPGPRPGRRPGGGPARG